MKKLKIRSSELAIRRAQMPTVSEFQAVKLTYEQAMDFDPEISTFDKLVARYGTANQLKVSEAYKGYIAVSYPWLRIDIVYMDGYVKHIDPSDASLYFDYQKAKLIREGRGWTVRYQTDDGHDCPGRFDYIWTFRGCHFASTISDLQKSGYLPAEMNAEAADKQLKDKLVAALTGNKIVEVTNDENLVLKAYLGTHSYYKDFFIELN